LSFWPMAVFEYAHYFGVKQGCKILFGIGRLKVILTSINKAESVTI